MGLTEEEALGALRLSLGRGTSEEEIEIASKLIVERYVKESAAQQQNVPQV